jgi:hypothetical protein
VLREGGEDVGCACVGGDDPREHLVGVVAPWQRRVELCDVSDAVVAERGELLVRDPASDPGAIDLVAVAQRQQVPPSVRSGVAVNPSMNFGSKYSMIRR